MDKWFDQTNKINNRENKIRKVMEETEKNTLKSEIDTLNNVLLIKKLAHDLSYIRAKLFFQN